MPENLTFDAALKQFVKSTKSSMVYAKACANMAIQHFQEHGDLCHAQSFLDAMPANYVRRVAFMKWLTAHSPATLGEAVKGEGRKLIKDKSPDAVAFDVEGALAVDFWEFAPDLEVISFNGQTIDQALRAVIKRFRNVNRYLPEAETALKHLDEVEGAIEKVALSPIAVAANG